MKTAAQVIHRETLKLRGGGNRPLAVIIKGGHLGGDAIDVLFDGSELREFAAARIQGPSPRGTGCRFSSAIAARLALGDNIGKAVESAKGYLVKYISGKH
jgi:hydroxymethylpyrimidine/phosphomethylpyrimidine kinase